MTPRARLWPSNVYPYGRVSYIKAGNRTLIVRGFLGLTSEESKVLLERALIAGRALEGYDYYACILTDYQARSLGVNVGDTITVDGLNLTVVGIVSSPVLTQIRDLDDLALTPLDPRTLPQYAMAQTRAQVAYPLSYDETLILPYKLVMDLGGSIWSIAVHFKGGITPEDVISISTQLAKMLDVPVYVSLRNSVVGCSRIVTWSLMGWGFALIVLVMGSLNIITTFMSHVRERSKDIVIYSAVGLPPSGTVTMFLIESLVHLSIVIPLGYVLGVAFNYVLYLGGVIPSTYVLNFSSLSLALSLLAIISVIILSSLYPALAASHAITPSLERRWKIPTSPRGDTWEIPLPVTAASRLEAVAMIVYLREYLEGSGKVTAHYTVIDAPTQGVDTLSFTVLLSPRELNITQRVTLIFQEVSKNRYVFTLNIRRLTGRYETWKTSNYFFVDHVRKQLLLWRSLREESRRSYVEAAQALLVKHPKNI